MNPIKNKEIKIKNKDKNKNTKTKNINPTKKIYDYVVDKISDCNCKCHTQVWCEECYGDFDLFEDLYK